MASILKDIINQVKVPEEHDLFDKKIDVNGKTNGLLSNLDDDTDTLGNFRVKVFGVGGAGCNVIDYMISARSWPENVNLYALNTDFKALKRIQGLTNVYLLGKKTLRGAGSGGDPLIGKASVDEATNDIRSVLENTDILFLVAGLGKGTGSGASPEIAKIANQLGILTIAIVNFPSVNAEGHNVYENALNSFDVLKDEVDSITKISNDRIINNDKSISFVNAFEKANIEVSSVVSDIVDMVDSASNMNLDFSDVRNFFKAHKTFMAGTFELKTEYSHKALDEAIKRSMKASFTDVNIKTGNIKILMNLRISTKVPSSVTNDIRNIFKDVTKDNSLTLVHGIDYVTDESFDGLKASYLVSASDEVLPIEEAPAINFGETVEDKNFNQTSANEDFINFTEYKTVDSDYKTGGVKRETIKFETEEILTDGERFNSREVNKLMTKAINSVMNNNYDSSDMPHKVTSKLH